MAETIAGAQARGEVEKSAYPSLGTLHLYAIFHAMLAFHLADCPPAQHPARLNALLQSAWYGMAPRSWTAEFANWIVRDGRSLVASFWQACVLRIGFSASRCTRQTSLFLMNNVAWGLSLYRRQR
jgi:hypothetical protein